MWAASVSFRPKVSSRGLARGGCKLQQFSAWHFPDARQNVYFAGGREPNERQQQDEEPLTSAVNKEVTRA